jgi:pimeloyl-ACP methyl ester carboxylesterase
MIHGMGAGLAFYALNFDELAKNRTVYAIDLPGFARSSRCKFNSKPEEAEKQYVRAIEDWRQKVGIGKMCLLGHSFGGNDSLKIPASTPHLKKILFRLLIFSICFKISGARVAFNSRGSLGVSGTATRGFKSASLVGQIPFSDHFQTSQSFSWTSFCRTFRSVFKNLEKYRYFGHFSGYQYRYFFTKTFGYKWANYRIFFDNFVVSCILKSNKAGHQIPQVICPTI